MYGKRAGAVTKHSPQWSRPVRRKASVQRSPRDPRRFTTQSAAKCIGRALSSAGLQRLPDGRHLAVVDALCSDRWIVAGDLQLIDTVTGAVRRIDTQGVDVTCTEWRSDRRLLLAGHRGFETVIGLYDLDSGQFRQRWASTELHDRRVLRQDLRLRRSR